MNWAIALAAAGALVSESGRHPAEYLHQIRTEVVTPHVAWLKPNAAGRPRVLFLVKRPQPLESVRMVVELWQRMDLEYVPFVFVVDERERDYWEGNLEQSRTSERAAEAVRLSRDRYDAIVLIHFDFKWLPTEAQYYLLRQVKAGTGLVGVNSRLAWPFKPAPAGVEAICAGVPLSGLPGYSSPEALRRFGAKTWQDLNKRIVETFEFKNGRIAYLRSGPLGIEPEDWTYANYHLSLVIRALQWVTAGIRPAVTFTRLPEGLMVDRAKLPVQGLEVGLDAALKAETRLTLRSVIRDRFGQERAAAERPVTLQPGANTLRVDLPVLPAGTHFVDLWLHSDKGVVQYGSFAVEVACAERFKEVQLEPAFADLGAPATEAVATFTAGLGADAELRATLTDTYGRQVATAAAAARAGADRAAVKLELGRVVALAQWARVELVRGGEVIDAAQRLMIVRRRAPYEFQSLLWGGVEGGLWGLWQLQRQRASGFNIALTGPSADGSSARFAALADMQKMIYATHVSGVSDGKLGKVSNPEVMAKWVKSVADNCRAESPYGIFVYSLGDECYTGPMHQPLAGTDIPAYQAFLRGRYKDLTELNEVWQTAYQRWEEIEPIDWSKAVEPKTFPQKHERMAFIEHLYAKAMHELAAGLKAMDPQARVGAEGSEPGDLELMLEKLEMWGPYRDRRIDVLLASVSPRETVRGMWWGGYHGGLEPRWSQINRFWMMVLEGVCNTNYFFDGHPGHHESNCGSDLSWAEYFRRYMPQLRQIYETPGPLLTAAQMRDDGVYLLWSQASEHAGQIYAPLATPAAETAALMASLDAAGVNYRFKTTRQILKQGLDPGQVRVLLLPMTTAIETEVAGALARYVESGGVVAATGTAGLMDGHCRLLGKGQLDGLFGLRRTGPASIKPTTPKGTCTLADVRIALTGPPARVDASVRADGAEVLLAEADVPLLTRRSAGRGVAVFLNTSLVHLAARHEGEASAADRLVEALLRLARIEPIVRPEPVGAARAYTFTLGDLTLISVVASDSRKAAQGRVRLARPAVVYDTLAAKCLGRLSELPVPAGEPPAALYALTGAESPSPQLEAPAKVESGQAIEARVTLTGGRGRLVRVDVYDPKGAWLAYYRRFVKLEGDAGRVTIPLALNDAPGRWTVKATDVATGVSVSRDVTVTR